MNRTKTTTWTLIAATALVLPACKESAESEKASTDKTESAAAPASAAPSAELSAALAQADAADGKTDKVVSKCAMCGLGMDGKAEFAVKAHDYELHLCSQACEDHFKQDPDKFILALKTP